MALDVDPLYRVNRGRIAWWAMTLALGAMFLFTVYSFVGTFTLALFVYYGTRPLYDRLGRVIDSDGVAAAVALFAVVTPTLLLAGYIVAVGLTELVTNTQTYAELLGQYVDTSNLNDPQEVFSTLRSGEFGGALEQSLGVLQEVTNGLLHLLVALAVTFYLLRDGDRIAAWFRSQVATEGSTAHAYATAVDRDFETLYFSYFLLVFLVAGLALVIYHGYNAVAPPDVGIPMPTFLALLTGVTSLVPIVVSKLVYVPVVAYVGVAASRADASFVYPAALLVVAFVLLDIFPQMRLLPRLAGRSLHVGLVMLSFIFGSLLFGWYGIFLGPLILVLTIHLVRFSFTELIHGDPLTPAVTAAESLGSPPASGRDADDT